MANTYLEDIAKQFAENDNAVHPRHRGGLPNRWVQSAQRLPFLEEMHQPPERPQQGLPFLEEARPKLPSPRVPVEIPPELKEESKIKDIWDAFRLGATQMAHRTKQFALSVLPNFLFPEATVPEVGSLEYEFAVKSGFTPEEMVVKTQEHNERFREIRETFKQQSIKAERRNLEWLAEHPELQPRKEWEKGVIETIKEDPKVLLDPAYLAFIAAESAAYAIAFLGTTLAVTATTRNPLLGLGAGVAITTPAQSQDLYEDLIASGATEGQAAQLAVPIGTVISSVEIVGAFPLLKVISKPFSDILRRNIQREVIKQTVAGLAKKGLITFTQVEIAEVMEEVAQGAIQDATVKTFDENRDLLENIPETVVRTAIATLPFALVGAGGRVRMEHGIAPTVEPEVVTPPVAEPTVVKPPTVPPKFAIEKPLVREVPIKPPPLVTPRVVPEVAPIVEKPPTKAPVAEVPKPPPEIARLVTRRAELKEMLAKPATDLPKGVKKIELRQELKGVSAKLVPAEKKLRQQIMATAVARGLTGKAGIKKREVIFKAIGGSRHLTDMDFTSLQKILPRIQEARAVMVKGKTVLKLQTEENIQSLKDILIAEQRLTPEIYESIKRNLELPTDRFESIEQFITESEAKKLIREMNYEAESGLAEWDAKVANALVGKPNIKASVDKLSHTIERENLPAPKRRTRINWRKFALEISEVPDDVGLSGTMSILRALRRFQEQLGGRSATRIYDVAEMMIETRQLNELRLTQRISEMKGEVPSLMKTVQSETSMRKVQQWLDADLAIAKVEKPTDMTDAELDVAKLFRKEYDQWKDVVRFERFKDSYYHHIPKAEDYTLEEHALLIKHGTEGTGDVAIPDAPLEDIKRAITIHESQGETALNEFLKTKTWGVLKSGYSFSQVIHPQLRIGQRLSVRATTTSLHQRKGLDFRRDERSAWERLIAYERQMIGLNLQPFFRKMDREFRHIVEQGRLGDPGADANKISLFLREVKGFPIESPVVRVLLRIGGWSFGTLAKVPWMSIRNLHQNLAFHPDKAEVTAALATGGFFAKPITRNGRLDYTDALVHQFRGVVQEQLLMGYMGKTPLENLIRVSDYYHLSDKLNRFLSMAGSGAKAERALKAFLKDGDAEKFLGSSGANELSQTEQIRVLEYLSQPNYDYGGVLNTVSGGEAAIRDIGKRITTLVHFNYTRYLRSSVEMGEMGRVIGCLVAFPRSVIERYSDFFSRLRPARKLSGVARRRAFHSLLAMVIGSAVASVLLSTITGKKRDAYNPFLVLQWQVGGLAIGATQELNELYRHLSNLAFAKEESEKDYALKELAILIPRLGDMFIPFYAPTMNAIEACYDERYIDRKTLRQLRAMFDEEYKPNLEFYEKERIMLEKWQHGLFGTRTADPSDLEQALLKLKGLKDNLGKVNEETMEKARQKALEEGKAFQYLPSDYIYTTSNLGSDFNRAVYGLDPTIIILENGFSPLLLDYLEYQELFDDYKDVPANKRYEFREGNPITDANLFFWGYVTTLQSPTAYNLVMQMMKKYNIPNNAIPALEKTEARVARPPTRPAFLTPTPTRATKGGLPSRWGE